MNERSPDTDPPDPTASPHSIDDLATLYDYVRQAFRLWYTPSRESPLAQLLSFQPPDGEDLHRFVSTRLLALLDEMAEVHAEEAQILRLRYLEGITAENVAHRLGMSASNLSKVQKKAIYRLAERIDQQEQRMQAVRRKIFLDRLEPTTYDSLFGIEEQLHALLQLLNAVGQPWLVALEGIGGIGKTTMADALIRKAIDESHFAGFGWVSARRQRFQLYGTIQTDPQPALTATELLEQLALQLLTPDSLAIHNALPTGGTSAVDSNLVSQLTTYLQAIPHLIVIDNLETVADLDALLPTLSRLANPTKFLLTARTSIYSETATYPFPIPELDKEAALALIRHEAALRNRDDLATASDAELAPIYAVVGGNPLALRLIVGQARIHTLDLILDDLRAARGRAVGELYTYIYRYAWDRLDDLSQRALIAMPLAPACGATIEKLADISKLPPEDLHNALNQLVSQSLVNRAGDFATSTYTIHSLTRTFLLEQVVHWRQ